MAKTGWKPGPDDRVISVACNVVEMPTPKDGAAPAKTRIHVLPWGETVPKDAELRTLLGQPARFIIDEQAAEMIRLNFEGRKIDHAVNLDHGRFDGSAVGWIQDIEITEDGGLAALTELTDRGRQLVKDKAYKYSSGELSVDIDSGRVIAITGLALTNRPGAEDGMRPVALSTLCAVPDARQEPARKGQEGVPVMDRPAWLARILGRNVEDDADAATAVNDLKVKADRVDAVETQLSTITEKVSTLETELSAMTERAVKAEKQLVQAELAAKIEGALKDGRLAPSQKEWAESLEGKALDAFLATIKPGTNTPPGQKVTGDQLKKAATTNLSDEGGERIALDASIRELMKAENISYSEAHKRLGKGRAS